jgi:hypothetical protein
MDADKLPRNARGEIASHAAERSATAGVAGALSMAGDLLLARCRDSQYSYDADFSTRPNGAFTYYALKTLTSSATATYADWFRRCATTCLGQTIPDAANLGWKRARQVKVPIGQALAALPSAPRGCAVLPSAAASVECNIALVSLTPAVSSG